MKNNSHTFFYVADYSHFENDFEYAKIDFMGFLNLKIDPHDPETLKDISGDYIKIGEDYVSVENSTILKDNDYLQIMTDIDYFDKDGNDWEDERMNSFIIKDPRNGTPPFSVFINTPFGGRDFDFKLFDTLFSTTTNKIYAVPEYL